MANWIAGAIKRPGALHRALDVPQGQPIPAPQMAQAVDSADPKVARMAALARTLKTLHR